MTGTEKAATSSHGLTPREMTIIAVVHKYCIDDGNLKVNYKALAEHGGFQNTKSASSSWSSIRKKLLADDISKSKGDANANGVDSADSDDDKVDSASLKLAKKSCVPRKRKAADKDAEVENGDPPAKKPRARKQKANGAGKGGKKSEAKIEKSSTPETEIMDEAVKVEEADGSDSTVVKGEPTEEDAAAV